MAQGARLGEACTGERSEPREGVVVREMRADGRDVLRRKVRPLVTDAKLARADLSA